MDSMSNSYSNIYGSWPTRFYLFSNGNGNGSDDDGGGSGCDVCKLELESGGGSDAHFSFMEFIEQCKNIVC